LLSSLGGIFNNLGRVHERQDQLIEADAAYKQAIAFQLQGLNIAPSAPSLRDSLRKQYRAHSQLLRKLGRPDEAAKAALAQRKLETKDPVALYQIFQELTASCRLMEPGPSREQCFNEALATLRLAWEAGFAGLPGAASNPLELFWGNVADAKRQNDRSASQATVRSGNTKSGTTRSELMRSGKEASAQ